MINTSQNYKEEIQATVRKVCGRVEIDYTDPFLDQSIEVSTNENAIVSYPEQVKDNIHQPYGKIASLDGSWVLDGTWVSAPTTPLEGQMGWWGRQLSREDGVFEEPYPTLIVTFHERPIRQLKIIGDINRGEYPVDFIVNMYDENGVLKHTEEIFSNTEVNFIYEYDNAITGISKMELILTKWSHSGRQAKIIEFITSIQEVYEGEEIISIDFLEERETSSGSLPIGNISSNEILIKFANTNKKFDVNNSASPLYQLLKQNRRIRAWIGVEGELIPLGKFWSSDWDLPEHAQYASVRGNDRLQLLSKTTYSTSVLKQNVSLYELAIDVLSDAGLSIEEYNISDDLHNYIIPYAYFPPLTHRDALQQIAAACLGQVYCDRYGVIRIEALADAPQPSIPELSVNDELILFQEDLNNTINFELIDGDLYLTSEQMLTKDNYFTKNSPVEWSQIANIVEMEITTKALDISQEIFNAELGTLRSGEIKEFQITYDKFPATDVSILSCSIDVISAKFYCWGAVITCQNNEPDETIVTIVLQGKPLIDGQTQKIIRQDQASILDNGPISYTIAKNPFFQSVEFGELLCDKLLAYYKNPQKFVDIVWRGDPSWELGDVVIVADDYSISASTIISQEYEFDGALRCRIKGRNV